MFVPNLVALVCSLWFVFSVFCLAIGYLQSDRWTTNGKRAANTDDTSKSSPRNSEDALKFIPKNSEDVLKFIPKPFNSICEDLFRETPAFNFRMSETYRRLSPGFNAAMELTMKTSGAINEGHSAQVVEETKVLHYIASSPFVKTICETGFNSGHSSFNYLTANDEVIVHSFDLGTHTYTRPMARFLNETFPGRLFVHFGYSTVTIPQFIKENPNFRCDFIFVDGGHTYGVATADINNFIPIASPNLNLITFDDYPTNWGLGFGKAWEDVRAAGKIREFMRCESAVAKKTFERGFVIGTVQKSNVDRQI